MNVLILLIGGNNVANFVPSCYLLTGERDDEQEMPRPEAILPLFSNETAKEKENLIRCLEEMPRNKETPLKIIDVPLEDYERDFQKTKDLLHAALSSLCAEQNASEQISIHLNYTGGTKTMAVAAYEAVRTFSEGKQHIACRFSYLDARSHQLKTMSDQDFPPCGDLRYHVKPSIEQLFVLHNLQGTPMYKTEITAEYCKTLQIQNFMQTAISHDFQEALGDFEETHKTRTWFRSQDICEENAELFKKLLQKYGLAALLEDTESIKDCRKIYSLVASEWMEQALFVSLQSIRQSDPSSGLSHIFWDIKGKARGKEFQVDVIALRGYEMILLSCTSEYREGICKQKAFEANYRAVQIAGIHAKRALVCLGNEEVCANISNDMAQFDANRNFSILGRKDLITSESLERGFRTILGSVKR
jgi:hypothetical protein